MMTPAAKRMKAYRQREADGCAVIPVNIKLVPVSELLIESELLDVSKAEDRKAIGCSIERLLELLIAARQLRDV